MKLLFSILFLTLSFSSMATKQENDLLINGNDTMYLRRSPLENLAFKFRPFGYTLETAPSRACIRGYKGVWRIVSGKLYLEKIIRCYKDKQKADENIIELFQKNGIAFETKDKMIFAAWYTTDLFYFEWSREYVTSPPGEMMPNERKREVDIRIEKGCVTKFVCHDETFAPPALSY